MMTSLISSFHIGLLLAMLSSPYFTPVQYSSSESEDSASRLEYEYAKKPKWQNLLDEDYTNYWEVFVGVPHGTVEGLEGVNSESDGKKGIPLGLNSDPKSVFQVKNEGGRKVLHISGEIYGAWSSKAEYENYHLQLQFKWGEKKWEPRLNRPKDSGILYHCQGAHGAFWNVWMSSLEFQVQEGDLGDFYALVQTEAAIATKKPLGEKEYSFDDQGEKHIFSAYQNERPLHCNKGANHENEIGEWNTLDLICIGDRALYLVNGKVAMELSDFKMKTEDGVLPLTKGKIQIQSEGAEVFYRGIKIKELGQGSSFMQYTDSLDTGVE
ncbi:3-keto-disaccharide hydrolase [Reichenbachiella ulvae]|uniref:DUF1080 domain-containing protein n=1 Tax=Reichenbachiella ulvae TaxID=2980104 RepID=A0ABT3CTA3_9BACT|nr:DUF1080 domain-containing protein [Reichenbachiella ulvae]MCV9386700.1 DUF1080 domain-containing protein [Reichenbachiella ulvae]